MRAAELRRTARTPRSPTRPPSAPAVPTCGRGPVQVLGLWVILGLAMMVGAALLGLKWFRVRAAKKLKMKEALARARRATLSRAASIKRNSRPSEHAATAPRGGRLLGLLAGGKGRAGRGPAAAPPAE